MTKNKEYIHRICKEYDIINYTINDDLSIDVDGNVNLYNKGLTKLPLKFNKVNGYFDCCYNKLTSLEGTPKEVTGKFDCSYNQLTSLEGAPNKVTGDFNCFNNKLTSLEGAPNKLTGNFNCSYNQLTSLEGAPNKVNGYFYCYYNKLTSLEYLPDIKVELYFHGNPIENKFKGKSVRQIRNYYKLKHILND
jgi:hypothetical protein